MFDVNKAIMRCLVKNLAMFGLGLYVYAGEDLPEDAALQPEAELQKQPKPRPTSQKQEQPPVPASAPAAISHQEGQAEGRLHHAGGRVCSHP